jgi:hypothetical protein
LTRCLLGFCVAPLAGLGNFTVDVFPPVCPVEARDRVLSLTERLDKKRREIWPTLGGIFPETDLARTIDSLVVQAHVTHVTRVTPRG